MAREDEWEERTEDRRQSDRELYERDQAGRAAYEAQRGSKDASDLSDALDQTLRGYRWSRDHDDEEEGGGKTCYIATATLGTFGSPANPVLDMLRGWRDRVLVADAAGREQLADYRRIGPKVAAFIEDKVWWKLYISVCYVLPGVAGVLVGADRFTRGVFLSLLAEGHRIVQKHRL